MIKIEFRHFWSSTLVGENSIPTGNFVENTNLGGKYLTKNTYLILKTLQLAFGHIFQQVY